MRYAQIINGRVHGVFEYDTLPEFASNIVMILLAEGSPVQAGWMYDGEVFSNPEPMPEEPTERKITRLAFLSRFSDAEAIALDLASIGSTVEAATIRRYMAKVNAASFIDLARDDTRTGVLGLEAVGLIAEGRALQILDAPIQPEEMPQ